MIFVTCDQKVQGLNPVWVAEVWTYASVTQLVYQRRGGVQNCLWLCAPKRPLGVCRKE